jgi:hypothetical protein
LTVGGGGLYWLVPALILALVGGMLNAWLLLLRLPSADSRGVAHK